MPKKREKVSQCTPSVQKMLDRVNSLSEEFSFKPELKHPKEAQKQKDLFYKITANLPDAFIKSCEWLQKILSGETLSPEETRKKVECQLKWSKSSKPTSQALSQLWIVFIPSVLTDDGDMEQILPLHQLYEELLWIKRIREILTLIREANSKNEKYPENEETKFSVMTVQDGIVKITAIYPVDILINERIDTRRIKQCQECQKFFWAKRLNKNIDNEACEKCANASRQRRFQSKKNKEEINVERRKNYYYKKGIPFCEKCIRPNTKCDCYLKERKGIKKNESI